jgi:hypothetical protein
MNKGKTPTINLPQKNFVEKDFFRTKLISGVNLDVKIGGGGRELER